MSDDLCIPLYVVVASFMLCSGYVQAQNNGDIRLVNNSTTRLGRLEIFMNDRWGTFCYNNMNSRGLRALADTACRQLRFKNAFAWGTVIGLGTPVAPGSTPIHIGSINCPSSDDDCSKNYPLHVLRCTINQTVDQKACTHDNDIAVYCYPQIIIPPSYESQILLYVNKLVYKPPINVSLSSGIVGIFFNQTSKPGLICGTGLDQDIADTACRQLGYTNAVSFNASFHTTKQIVWDTGLKCSSKSYSCVNKCFSKKPTKKTTCTSVVAVSCEFQLSLKDTNPSGSLLRCDANYCSNPRPRPGPNIEQGSSTLGTIITVIVIVAIVAACVTCVILLLCCLVPGCVFYRGRNHRARSHGDYQKWTQS